MTGVLNVRMKVLVSPAARFVFHRNVEYVLDSLGFQLSQSFLLITVNKRATPDNSLAGTESPVRAGCNRTASQVVQLVDYSTLNGRCILQKEVTILKSLTVLTEPTVLQTALSRTNGDNFETG